MPYIPLNATVVPVHYDLHLNPFEGIQQGNDTFSGRMDLECRLTGPTSEIRLHGEGIKVRDVHVENDRCEIPIPPEQIEYQPDETYNGGSVIAIKFGQTLDQRVRLSLNFTGTYGKTQGLYRATYTKADGTKGVIVTTDSEPEKARSIFPCIDNPAAKATYRITAEVLRDLEAVSNMPVERTYRKPNGETKTVCFETTPPMSTYLVYLGVGAFDVLEGKAGKTDVRILTTPGKREQAHWALEVAQESLRFFEEYFGIPYMLPKLDLIALPEFTAGAMENWGASTFREANLLYNQETGSPADKLKVATVVAHEIAHQWFGDLVTMQWWEDLWLNESFAELMSYEAIERLCADLDPWVPFFQEAGKAFREDGLSSSHPIRTEVKTAGEAIENFDSISYHKGAMVLRMVEAHVGRQAFRDGIRSYLSQHKYGNAEGADLWTALKDASGKPEIADLVEKWVTQKGYPVVQVTLPERLGDPEHIGLRQELFHYRPKADQQQDGEALWPVPLVMLGRDYSEARLVLAQREGVVSQFEGDLYTVNVNRGRGGFFRVAYPWMSYNDGEMRPPSHAWSNVERWAVHDDMAAFTLTGKIPLKNYLACLKQHRQEHAYLVWTSILETMRNFSLLAQRERKMFDNIQRTGFALLGPQLNRLGTEPRAPLERKTDKTLRAGLLYTLGRLDDPTALDWAQKAFERQLTTGTPILSDLRGTAYALAAWQGNTETLAQLKKLHEQGRDDARERRRVLEAMAEFKDPVVLRDALDFVLSDAVRQQDRLFTFLAAGQNPYGNGVLWEWMREHWTVIRERYGEGISSHYLGMILTGLGSLADVEKGREITDFVKAHPVSGTERALKQLQEGMEINAKFLRVNRE